MAESSGNTRSIKNFIVDGEFLTQLLECPVCLGQLKSSSRVLPCQHTFCERCLYEVYKAKNRLDCPECRMPVNIPFKHLPRNILLVRFLEGVKNKKVRNAEEVYPRSARSLSLKQASLPQSSSNIPTAADVVYKKMKEDPQYKAIIENLNGNKRASKVPATPGTSAKRISEPEKESQNNTSMGRMPIPGHPPAPSDSAKNILQTDKDAKAAQNLRRLCDALKASQSNFLAKKSNEPTQCYYESRFRKRNKHILTKIMRAVYYPNYCSYTGARKNSGSG